MPSRQERRQAEREAAKAQNSLQTANHIVNARLSGVQSIMRPNMPPLMVSPDQQSECLPARKLARHTHAVLKHKLSHEARARFKRLNGSDANTLWDAGRS